MTLFIASLFLPYTINFDSDESIAEQASRPLNEEAANASHDDSRESRLVNHSTSKAQTMPKTPGATTNLEAIFQPHIERPFNLIAPSPRGKKSKEQKSANGVSNTSLHRSSSSKHLSDLYSPSLDNTPFWNQPASRAKSPPPSDVRYYKAQVLETATRAWSGPTKNRDRSRNTSNERKFTEDNYTIEQARRGNGGLFNVIDTVSDAGLLTDKTWVGTLGMPTDALQDHLKEIIAERLEDGHQSLT